MKNYNPRGLWNKFSIFTKTYILSVALTMTVVALGEGAEWLAEHVYLSGLAQTAATDLEPAIWATAIFLSSLAVGFVLSRLTTSGLKRLRAMVKNLSEGDLKVRASALDARRADEIGDLARGFNLMADNLGKFLENERRLMADISHEMRSPLARMKIALALAEKKLDPPSNQAALAYLKQIDQDVELLDGMVGQILERARLEAALRGEKGGEKILVDVGVVVKNSVEAFAFAAAEAGKSLCLNFSDQPALCCGQAGPLRRMIDNLIKNALYYTPPNTTVTVDLRVEGGFIILQVADQGPGAPPELLSDIFRPFYRVAASRDRHHGGVGLGLDIVRQAALAHGGTVEAENIIGPDSKRGGLAVVIKLPAA